MAEKIRPPHLPPTSLPSQQPLLVSPSDGSQHGMLGPKVQQVQGHQSHSPSQPDIALHARPASSTVSGSLPPPAVTRSIDVLLLLPMTKAVASELEWVPERRAIAAHCF